MRLSLTSTALAAALTVAFSASAIQAQSLIPQPSSLVFEAPTNTFIPLPQTTTITVTGGAGLSLSAQSNSTWLTVSPNAAIPNPSGALNYSISVNPSGLANGSYTGQVTFSMPPAQSQPVIVRLNVGPTSGSGQIQTTPTALTFNVPPGSTSSTSQNIQLTSIGSGVNFTANALVTSPPGGFWLSVSPTAGSTPTTLTVTANPQGLTAGSSYQGNIVVSSGGVTAATIPVTLNFSSETSLVLQPSALTFNYQTSGTPPPGQTILASFPGGNASTFQVTGTTASGGNWLQVAPAQATTPTAIGVSINNTVAAGLTAGTYTGTVTLTPPNQAQAPFTVPVTLNVSASPLLSVPSTLIGLTAVTNSSNSVTQSFTVTSTGGSIPVTATGATTSGGSWLTVTQNSTVTPSTITLSANPSGLASGVYQGTVTLSTTAAGNSSITIPVRFSLSSSGLLSTTPRELSFTYSGSGTPAPQTFNIVSSGAAVPFTTNAQVLSPVNGNWIGVSPSGVNTPGSATVSINQQGVANLAPGTYQALVTVSSGIGDPIYVPVSLTVTGTGGSGSLTVSPAALTFSAQSGGTAQTQTVQVTGPSTTSFTATASTTSGGNWLAVTPTSGTGGTSLQITATPGSLANGTYQGTVSILAAGSTTPATVQVTLSVGTTSGNTLTASPSSLTFSAATGGGNPASQSIQVTAAAGSSFTVNTTTTTGGSWLSATPANSSTPGTIQVAVNSSGLAAGSYTGAVTLTPSSGTPTTVPVTLTVGGGSGTPSIQPSPASLTFTIPTGGSNPAPQNLTLSASTNTNFTTNTTTTTGGNWLQVSPFTGTTPATLQVIVTAGSLAAGTYNGTITVTPTGAGAAPTVVPVTLTIGGASTSVLQTAPAALTFTGTPGGSNPSAQSVQVTASTPTPFTASVTTTSGNWLTINQTSATTPATFQVSANITGLAAGTYNGTVTFTPTAGGTPATVPVTLTLGATTGSPLQVSPGSLTFSSPAGGTPPSQTLQVTATGSSPVNYFVGASTDSGGSWLSIDASSGATPGTVRVSINTTGLMDGTYRGSVNISPAAGGTITVVPVTLNIGIGGPTGLVVSPTTVTIQAPTGGANPAPVAVQVSSQVSTNYTTSVTTSTGGNWLSVTPANGTTPGTVQISANISGLPQGSYTGSVTLTPAAGTGGQPVNIPVTLTIGSSSGGTPTITAVVNGASFLSGTTVAPGEIVSIFGSNLGPTTGVGLSLDSQGRVNTTLNNIRVLFDNVPAPLLYVRNDQINAVVPYAVATRTTTTVQVEVSGVRSASTVLNVVPTAPGIFTLTAATPGRGQGAVLNQNGTVNSTGTPAARGSIVSVYLTGEGQTNPAGVDGEVASATNPRLPVAPVVIRVGGVAVLAEDILYAGSAPGSVSGAMQINFRVPTAIQPGAQSLDITIGQAGAQSAVTIAVQ